MKIDMWAHVRYNFGDGRTGTGTVITRGIEDGETTSVVIRTDGPVQTPTGRTVHMVRFAETDYRPRRPMSEWVTVLEETS